MNFSGRYVLVANKDGFQAQTKDVTISDGRPASVEFRMSTNHSPKILIGVRSQDSNEPINGASVLVQVSGSSNEQRYTVRSNGFITLSSQNDPRARYTIQVSHPDFDPGTAIVQSRNASDGVTIVALRRRTSERSVVVRAMDSSSRSPISRARVTFEGGNERKTATTDSTGTVSVRLSQRAIYTVIVESNDHQTYTERIDLTRPDTSVLYKTYQLRSGVSTPGLPSQGAKLSGDIRMKGGRIGAGDVVTADVGVFYSDYPVEKLPVSVSVKVYAPSGTIVANETYRQDLLLNTISRHNVDIRTREEGKYTIRVSATGSSMRTWTSDKTFEVGRTQTSLDHEEGIYNGSIDLINLSGTKVAHTISIKITKRNGNRYDLIGNLGPGRLEGFHIQFSGTYDIARKSINAIGEMLEEDHRRWDVRLSGTVEASGRLKVTVSLRSADNRYNRRADASLKKN